MRWRLLLENDFRTTAFTGTPPGAALNVGSPHFANVRASILKTLGQGVQTARSKTVTRRHNADLATCAGALRGLGRVVADVGHDVGPGLWLMAYDARGFEPGPLLAARLVGTRRFPCQPVRALPTDMSGVGCRCMNRDTDWDGRPIYYDRQGRPMTLHQWAEKFQDEEYTHIARDVIGPDEPLDPAPLITVSTFWLGVNPNWRHDEPLIYETLIIGGGHDATGMRYASEKQAREGHRRVVDELRAGRGARDVRRLAPPSHAQSTLTDEWHAPRSAVSADGWSHGRHRRVAQDN
jgi:hypothetical protein